MHCLKLVFGCCTASGGCAIPCGVAQACDYACGCINCDGFGSSAANLQNVRTCAAQLGLCARCAYCDAGKFGRFSHLDFQFASSVDYSLDVFGAGCARTSMTTNYADCVIEFFSDGTVILRLQAKGGCIQQSICAVDGVVDVCACGCIAVGRIQCACAAYVGDCVAAVVQASRCQADCVANCRGDGDAAAVGDGFVARCISGGDAGQACEFSVEFDLQARACCFGGDVAITCNGQCFAQFDGIARAAIVAREGESFLGYDIGCFCTCDYVSLGLSGQVYVVFGDVASILGARRNSDVG